MFVRAYDVIDTEYWPAHLAAAEYYVRHDNSEKGETELKSVLNANRFEESGIRGTLADNRFRDITLTGRIRRSRRSER